MFDTDTDKNNEICPQSHDEANPLPITVHSHFLRQKTVEIKSLLRFIYYPINLMLEQSNYTDRILCKVIK